MFIALATKKTIAPFGGADPDLYTFRPYGVTLWPIAGSQGTTSKKLARKSSCMFASQTSFEKTN